MAGASIQLYAAGSSGYGTGATALLSAPVYSDSGGGFSITGSYTCPSAASQLYIVASGGNPGLAAGTNNPALKMMAALGPCHLYGSQYTLDPSSFLVINEVTTVAAVYGLNGFMDTGTLQVGASSTNAIGLANAFQVVHNLVDSTTGLALAVTPAGNGVAPQATVNTLANVLAACVNSDGTGAACTGLFTAVTPSGGTAPTDTLQATLNVARSPATQVAALYGLTGATPPFQPMLSTAPNDWTLTLVYSTYGSSQGGLAIDAAGNVWISNIFTSSTNLTSSITELSNSGTVLSGAVGFTGGGLNRPGSISIDPSGNVWLANTFTSSLSKFGNDGTPISGISGYVANTTGPIANDGLGNVWYATGIGAGKMDSQGNVIPVASTASAGFTGTSGISVDTSENVWVSVSVDEYTNYFNHVVFSEVQKFANDGTVLSGTNGYMQNGMNYVSAIANDNAGNAWALSNFSLSPSVRKLKSDGTFLSGANGYTGAGLSNPRMIAIDGAGTAWVPGDYVATVNGSMASITNLVAVSNSGAILSGAGGYVVNRPAGYPVGVALDSSGNVWICLYESVVQVVGVATPVVTPLSVGVQHGTLATRP